MTHPPGCADLACLLTRLRLQLHSETPGAINQHASPVLRDYQGITESKYPDEGGIGMPMTAAMHRFLEGPDAWGLSRLGMLSIIEVSDACASRHPNHRRPMFTRTLCGQLAYEAGYLGQSVEDIAWAKGIAVDQVAGLLTWGLRHAESWRADRFAQWSKVPGEDAPLPERRPYRPTGRAA